MSLAHGICQIESRSTTIWSYNPGISHHCGRGGTGIHSMTERWANEMPTGRTRSVTSIDWEFPEIQV